MARFFRSRRFCYCLLTQIDDIRTFVKHFAFNQLPLGCLNTIFMCFVAIAEAFTVRSFGSRNETFDMRRVSGMYQGKIPSCSFIRPSLRFTVP